MVRAPARVFAPEATKPFAGSVSAAQNHEARELGVFICRASPESRKFRIYRPTRTDFFVGSENETVYGIYRDPTNWWVLVG